MNKKELRQLSKNQLIDIILEQERHINVDETGLRKDGQKGQVWGIFTNGIALLNAELSRGKWIANKLLSNYGGLCITDGYKGYDDIPLRQRCWTHLIREFEDLTKKYKDAEVFHRRIKKLYNELKGYTQDVPENKAKKYFKFQLNDIVGCLKTQKWGRKLAKLTENGGDDWFNA